MMHDLMITADKLELLESILIGFGLSLYVPILGVFLFPARKLQPSYWGTTKSATNLLSFLPMIFFLQLVVIWIWAAVVRYIYTGTWELDGIKPYYLFLGATLIFFFIISYDSKKHRLIHPSSIMWDQKKIRWRFIFFFKGEKNIADIVRVTDDPSGRSAIRFKDESVLYVPYQMKGGSSLLEDMQALLTARQVS